MMNAILSICGTLAVYYGMKEIYRRTGSLWLMPLIVCPILIVGFLMTLDIPYADYRAGGQWLQWLLSPVTVAFAVPLYRQRRLVRKYLVELLAVGIVAAVTAMTTSMLLSDWFGVSHEYVLSLAPRSITTPLAMNVSSMLGGNATITAIFVILTGVIGMLLTVCTVRILNVHNPLLRGLFYGLTAHGTGTARAYEESEKTGVIASVAMIFMGVLTALIAPLVIPAMLWILF